MPHDEHGNWRSHTPPGGKDYNQFGQELPNKIRDFGNTAPMKGNSGSVKGGSGGGIGCLVIIAVILGLVALQPLLYGLFVFIMSFFVKR